MSVVFVMEIIQHVQIVQELSMGMEGRAAGQAVRRRAAPVDTAIVGVIDSVTH